MAESGAYVSRGGEKLAEALDVFALDVTELVCADLGSHVGGFVDCLLQRGAARVHSVDTAYGVLAWRLRRDARVVVRERTNAMHVTLPEPVDLVTVDVGWTPQARILPRVVQLLGDGGCVITLIKPHYETTPDQLVDGALPDDVAKQVVSRVLGEIEVAGWRVLDSTPSPLRGHGGNREHLALLARGEETA